MEFRDCFDKIIERFSTDQYRAEIEKARMEFSVRTGTVYEDNPIYIERMNLFLDWYVFERALDSEDMTPLEYYYKLYSKDLADKEIEFFEGMRNSISSLFLVKKVRLGYVYVKDLFSGKGYKVSDNYVMRLVNRGDVLQGRLIPLKDKNIFTRGFCFHPPETLGYIKSEIKKIKNMLHVYHTAFMEKVAFMKVKTQEYAHVPVEHIYNKEPKVRF